MDESMKKDIYIAVIAGLCVTIITSITSGVSGYYKDNYPSVKIKNTMTSWFSCRLDNGERCVLFSAASSYVPYYSFDIQNNSEKTLYFNDNEAVEVDLIEFIPYDELNIVSSSGGADGWNDPTEFELNMSTDLGIQYARPMVDGKQKKANEGFLSIESNKMDRFMLRIYPEEKGYYRFIISINYIYNNEKFSYQTEEFRIVCEKGSNELLRQRTNKTSIEKMGENDDEETKNEETFSYDDNTEGQWLVSSYETFNDKGYILGWTDYLYNDRNLLHTEIGYDGEGNETLRGIYTYTYDDNWNVLTQRYDSNLNGRGWRCDYYNKFEYDTEGNIIRKNAIDTEDDTILWYYTYSYREGLLVREEYHNKGNGHVTDYTYDGDGNILIVDNYYEYKSQHTCIKYYYENNLLIKKQSVNADEYSGYTSYEYDERGNLICETVYDKGPKYAFSYNYEYDEYGNRIKKIFNDEGIYSIYKYKLSAKTGG